MRWRRASALALGTLLAVPALELAYRLLRVPALSPTTNPGYVVHDDELGWRYRPGARARHRNEEFDVEIAINAQGFRGPDWSLAEPGKRVLVLGDSFAFGWGVPWEATFTARLQAEHPEWSVLNAAVSGYATDQELLLLRRLLPELRPDVVVCVFCPNDLWEASSAVVYGKAKPRFVLRGEHLETAGVPVTRSWLERTSQLWQAALKLRWEREFAERRRDRREEWRLVSGLYRALRDEAGGVPVVILSSERRLAALAREEPMLEHVDLGRVLLSPPAGAHFLADGHWSADGHAATARVAGETLARLLR